MMEDNDFADGAGQNRKGAGRDVAEDRDGIATLSYYVKKPV
jgi:hypothetical protein